MLTPRARRPLVLLLLVALTAAGLPAAATPSPARAATDTIGSLSFRSDPYPLLELPIEQLPYYSGVEQPLPGESDQHGVYMALVGGELLDHPAGQAQRALKALGNYRLSSDPAMLEIAIANATRILERSVNHESAIFFPYPYDVNSPSRVVMRAPWYSGLAQGQALQAFVRLYEWTGDGAWLDAAHAAAASFTVAPSAAPWVSAVEAGLLWFDQYPQQPLDKTFNGHLFATFGLYDYWRVTGSEVAARLIRGAITTAALAGGEVRHAGGGPSWYCLSVACRLHKVRHPTYHPVHIGQFVTLLRMTGHPRFGNLAEQLLSDAPADTGGGSVRLHPGTHIGYTFEGADPVATAWVTISSPSVHPYEARDMPVWRSNPLNGVWMLVSDGPLAGTWVKQTDRAVPVGFTDVLDFAAARPINLLPGTYTGRTLTADGRQVDGVTADLSGPFSYTRLASIDGVRAALIADGPLAGRWLTLDATMVRDFYDADLSPFATDISWLVAAGVTRGCAAERYCPLGPVTREQMASFLVRALGLPPSAGDQFSDDEGSTHEADINAVAAAGITLGCGDGRYCPRVAVTRDQMASFLVRAIGLQPSSADRFSDDEGSTHEADINAVAAAGITNGCGGGRYCPRSVVTREQMAAFLRRAFE